MKRKLLTLVMFSFLVVFMNVIQVEAAGKYDESLYQDVLNYPACYSGTVEYERGVKVENGATVTLKDDVNLKYFIKDITGDKIKELFVMDQQHLFIFTQKYNKKSKKMKVSVMTVLSTNATILDVYYRKINGKRYVGIDWKYTGTGTTTKTVFCVKGKKLSLQNLLRYVGPWQGDTDTSYWNNNKQITKKKYKSYTKKYFAKKYKVKYKVKKISEKSTPSAFYTMTDKINPSMVIIGGYANKNVWSAQARTYMTTYALTRTTWKVTKKKVKLSAVKKEMKNLFGTTTVKFSKSYPYNTMKKKGKWVTYPIGDFGEEYPGCDLLDTYKIGKNTYRARYISYTEAPYYEQERLNLKTYYITFKKSSGKYGYIISDIREIPQIQQTETTTDSSTNDSNTNTTEDTTSNTEELAFAVDTCEAFYNGYYYQNDDANDGWIITGDGLGISGTLHYSRALTESEILTFSQGGVGYKGTVDSIGAEITGGKLWSTYKGYFMIDLPDNITAGQYVYYIYQYIGSQKILFAIEFKVTDSSSGKVISNIQVK